MTSPRAKTTTETPEETAGSGEKAALRPDHGVRLEIVRDAQLVGTAFIYRGHVHTPTASKRVEVRVTAEAAKASIEHGDAEAREIDALEKTVSALVRAASRSHLVEGRLPPRRIVRWRS